MDTLSVSLIIKRRNIELNNPENDFLHISFQKETILQTRVFPVTD